MAALAKIQRKLESPVVAGAAIAATAALSYFVVRALQGLGSPGLPDGVVAPRASAVPFAKIRGRLVWPVLTNEPRYGEVGYVDVLGDGHGNLSRRFGASRDGRRHAGVDLYADNGDVVVAMADGTVIDTQTFHLGSWAILVQHNGAVILYGEVEKNSWQEFGVEIGSRVNRGQPIARIACMQGTASNCSSHMLHLETYTEGTTQNQRWTNQAPPPALLDPTYMLLSAAPAEPNLP